MHIYCFSGNITAVKFGLITLQNGQIFMFTGMLKVLHNADSLAVVLGHEMSHVVLQHTVCKIMIIIIARLES